MNPCIFCSFKTNLLVGIALGMVGNDYAICEDCMDTRTIKELLVLIQETGIEE